MKLELEPKLEAWLEEVVAEGRFGSREQVVIEALRLLRELESSRQARLQDLRREIARGLDEAERGQTRPFDDQVIREIRQGGLTRLNRSSED